jgi:hypothetical protein
MTTYNGYTNYETWAVGMYLDGNYDGEGTYKDILEITREQGADKYDTASELQTYLQGTIENSDPDGIASSGIIGDLLGAALSEVNWLELAEHKCTEIMEEWTTEAKDLGASAARDAATWVTDGNSSAGHVRRLLTMLEEGDPAADGMLPNSPNLSGEWADDPTPLSLARDVTGLDEPADEIMDALATAFEAGVSDAFMPAVEAELRRFIGEEVSS